MSINNSTIHLNFAIETFKYTSNINNNINNKNFACRKANCVFVN